MYATTRKQKVRLLCIGVYFTFRTNKGARDESVLSKKKKAHKYTHVTRRHTYTEKIFIFHFNTNYHD
jgi:hypothetical protein